MNVARGRRSKFGLITAGLIGVVVYVIFFRLGADEPSALHLRPPPGLPSITAHDIDSDALILPAISQESMRLLIQAGRCSGDVRDVLSPTLRHLYTIRAYESAMSSGNSLAEVARMSVGPTPMLPPIEDLIEAYRELREDALAQCAIDFAEAVRDRAIDEPSEAISRRFLESLKEPGLTWSRIRYARAHRDDILPKASP